jgi:hypothetical protein
MWYFYNGIIIHYHLASHYTEIQLQVLMKHNDLNLILKKSLWAKWL